MSGVAILAAPMRGRPRSSADCRLNYAPGGDHRHQVQHSVDGRTSDPGFGV